jgi:hypothetical protein
MKQQYEMYDMQSPQSVREKSMSRGISDVLDMNKDPSSMGMHPMYQPNNYYYGNRGMYMSLICYKKESKGNKWI